MANSTTTNPIVLDTFSSDIIVTSSSSRIVTVVLKSLTGEDHFTLEDPNGINVIDLVVPGTDDTDDANTVVLPFGFPGFFCGRPLTCDVSDGTYNSGTVAYIYLA